MSVHAVIRTLRDCLADSVFGLAAAVGSLASSSEVGALKIRTEFHFVKWKLAGTPQPTGTPNVMLRPGVWRATIKQANHRDGLVVVEVGAEWFDADVDVLQDNITIAAVALAKVLDGLRDYSDANNGNVIDVIDPIEFRFGEFDSPASSGFIATIQIEERGSQ